MKTWLPWLAFSIALAFVARDIFPKKVEVLVPGPAPEPRIVVVDETDTAAVRELEAAVKRQRDRIRDLEGRQPTENIVQTIYVPVAPDTVDVCQGETLAPSWYVTTATAGESFGDEASITATRIEADSAALLLHQETALVFATGPLMGVQADSAGYSLLFDPDGFPDPPCKFWCSAKKMAIGGGITLGILALFDTFK